MIYLAQQSFPQSPNLLGKYYDFTTDEELNDFIVTAVSSGTAAVTDTNSNLPTTIGGSNGVLLLSGAETTDDSGSNLSGDSEWIRIAAGKTYFFQTRIALSDATESDLLAGVAVQDTSLIASVPTDGIYFLKSDGATTLKIQMRAASATVVDTAISTVTSNTYTDLAWKFVVDSGGTYATLFTYQDGTSLSSTRVSVLPTSEAMTLALAFQSGTATGTISCGVDNIGAWQQRV